MIILVTYNYTESSVIIIKLDYVCTQHVCTCKLYNTNRVPHTNEYCHGWSSPYTNTYMLIIVIAVCNTHSVSKITQCENCITPHKSIGVMILIIILNCVEC